MFSIPFSQSLSGSECKSMTLIPWEKCHHLTLVSTSVALIMHSNQPSKLSFKCLCQVWNDSARVLTTCFTRHWAHSMTFGQNEALSRFPVSLFSSLWDTSLRLFPRHDDVSRCVSFALLNRRISDMLWVDSCISRTSDETFPSSSCTANNRVRLSLPVEGWGKCIRSLFCEIRISSTQIWVAQGWKYTQKRWQTEHRFYWWYFQFNFPTVETKGCRKLHLHREKRRSDGLSHCSTAHEV